MKPDNNNDIMVHTRNVLKIISEKFDINYDDMMNLINLELNLRGIYETHDKCHAYISVENDVRCRCKNDKSKSIICNTHYMANKNNELKYGFVPPTKKDIIATEKVVVGKNTYLYDKIRRKLYTIPKPNEQSVFVGYLSENKKHIIF
jgi:hypothetical protein